MSPSLFPWATLAPRLPEQSHCRQPFPVGWGLGFTVPGRVGCAPAPAAPAVPGLRQPWDELFQRQRKQRPARAAAPGTSAGPGGGSSSLTQNLLHPALSSPSDAHLLPRGCWGGVGPCLGQLGGLNLLQTLLRPWWSPQQRLLWLPVSASTGSRGCDHEQSRSSGSRAGGPRGQPWGLLCGIRPPGPAEVGRSKAKHREPREGVFSPPGAGKTFLPQDTATHLVL